MNLYLRYFDRETLVSNVDVAVIVACPSLIPRIKPEEETLTVVSSLDDQVTESLAVSGVTEATLN